MKYLMDKKIIAQQHYIPIYKFSIYKKKNFFFNGSKNYYENSVSIPIYVDLNKKNKIKSLRQLKII